jgi:TonB family protein
MRYKLLVLLSILGQISYSQEDIKFSKVDSNAEFPNGLVAFYQKIRETLTYPQSARMQGKQGKVFVEFTISAEGFIVESSVKTIKTFDGECARSAEAALKSIKVKWTPAKLNGLPTSQVLVIPIVFSLDPPSGISESEITDEVYAIKAIVVPKGGTPKKRDWAIYADMSMNKQIGSVFPGDSVKIVGWGPWLYKIKSSDNEGYISWKAIESEEDLSSIRKKIELHSANIEKRLSIEDSLKSIQTITIRNSKNPVLMDSTSKVFFKVSASKSQMVVGDCSVIELALFISYRNDLRLQFHDVWTTVSQVNSIFSFLNCWHSSNNISKIKSGDITLNGQGYSKYVIFEGSLCAIDSRNVTIPPLNLTLIKYNNTSDKIGSLVSLKSKPVRLKILPIDQSMNLVESDFYFPIGDFTLTDSVHKSPNSAFTYSVNVQGSGFTFPLKAPNIKWAEGKGILIKTEYSDTIINKALVSSKTFYYTLNFNSPGNFSLSESIRFSFYNPKLEKVYELKSDKFLNIQKGDIQSVPSETHHQKDNVIVMDVSQSMMIEDYSPNRLSVVKLGVANFLKTDTYCDLDIVIFGGQALRLQPDIKSRCYSNLQVQRIDFEDVENGTAIGNGIFLAIQLILESKKDKKIVIIGDGDNTAGQVPVNVAINLAKKYGVKVYSIGVGNNGIVPFGRGVDGSINYVENTFFDSDLKRIALETGGKYFWAKDAQSITSALDQIF